MKYVFVLLAVFLASCQTPSVYHFESHKADGSWAKADASLAPKDLTGGVLFIFGSDGSLTLQAGDIESAPDPYAQIMTEVLKVAIPATLCADNPIFCTQSPGDE